METILFACIGNSCRSQMAEGFARFYAKKPVNILSAGTQPSKKIDENAIFVMKELGIDISKQYPKSLTTQMVKETTFFVSMGCGVQDSCPVPLFSVHIEDWEIEDPVGQSLEVFRNIRNQIQKKVHDLLDRLKLL